MPLGSSIFTVSQTVRTLRYSLLLIGHFIIFRVRLRGLSLFLMTSDTFLDPNANRTFQSVSHAHWCPAKHEFLGVEIILKSFIAQMSENASEQLKNVEKRD